MGSIRFPILVFLVVPYYSFVSFVILMENYSIVLSLIIILNDVLFLLSYHPTVGNMEDIEYHTSSKY